MQDARGVIALCLPFIVYHERCGQRRFMPNSACQSPTLLYSESGISQPVQPYNSLNTNFLPVCRAAEAHWIAAQKHPLCAVRLSMPGQSMYS